MHRMHSALGVEYNSRLFGYSQHVQTWVENHLAFFHPLDWNEPSERALRRKAFAELALYVYIVKQMGLPISPKVSDFVVSIAITEDYLNLLFRSEDVLQYGIPLAVAKEANSLDEKVERRLVSLLEEPRIWCQQRVQYRLLDLLYLSKIVGLKQTPVSFSDLLPLTYSQQIPTPIWTRLTEAYAFTHQVFYFSSFGMDYEMASPFVHACGQDPGALPCLISRFIAEDNYDISLELVFTGIVLNSIPNPYLALTLDWAVQALNTHGIVPSPKSDFYLKPFAGNESAELWASSYHTMLVFGATCSLASLSLLEEKMQYSHSEAAEFFAVGSFLACLANHDFHNAASCLESTLLQSNNKIVRDCASYTQKFLETQVSASGEVGLFCDESRLHFLQYGTSLTRINLEKSFNLLSEWAS